MTQLSRYSLAVFIMLWLLNGCTSSSPNLHYYQLPLIDDSALSIAKSSTERLYVQPIQLASFLRSGGIVYQTSAVEANQAQRNLWAGNLSEILTNALISQLRANASSNYLLTQETQTPNTLQLVVYVEQFQGSYTGFAVASGRFQLKRNQQILLDQPFKKKIILVKDGYPALVEALDQAWQQVSQQIIKSLMSLH